MAHPDLLAWGFLENYKNLFGAATTLPPDGLRAIGDSPFGAGKTYHFDPKS